MKGIAAVVGGTALCDAVELESGISVDIAYDGVAYPMDWALDDTVFTVVIVGVGRADLEGARDARKENSGSVSCEP